MPIHAAVATEPSGAFDLAEVNQSGRDRMRGLAVLDDFVKYKHVAFVPAVVRGAAAWPLPRRC